jgi:hypothetical protein
MLSDNQVIQIQGISYDTLLNNFKEIVKDGVKKYSNVQTEIPETPDRYLSGDEAQKLLGNVSGVTLWEWRKKKIITGYRIGNKVMYKYSELMACGKLIVN